jgi:hypothetical protein
VISFIILVNSGIIIMLRIDFLQIAGVRPDILIYENICI